MHETILSPGWGTFVVAVPFVGMLFATVFRLDELFASPANRVRRRRGLCGLDQDGQQIFCDPDGTRWGNKDVQRQPRAARMARPAATATRREAFDGRGRILDGGRPSFRSAHISLIKH